MKTLLFALLVITALLVYLFSQPETRAILKTLGYVVAGCTAFVLFGLALLVVVVYIAPFVAMLASVVVAGVSYAIATVGLTIITAICAVVFGA